MVICATLTAVFGPLLFWGDYNWQSYGAGLSSSVKNFAILQSGLSSAGYLDCFLVVSALPRGVGQSV